MSVICIHHNKDLDGFSSGALVKLKYPEAKLIGWDYKDDIPSLDQFKDQDVIMIDISFPMEKIEELRNICKHLTIIDHHVSFLKDFQKFYDIGTQSDTIVEMEHIKPKLKYIYNVKKAACEIGWKHLFPGEAVPYAITLLGRYDTWRQQEGNWEDETLPFQYYMRTACTSAETFPLKSFDMMWVAQAVTSGRTVVTYQEQQDMLACERSAFLSVIGDHPAICLNTRAFSSNTMKSVYDPEKHDVMLGFEYNGSKWSVSLRTDKPTVDVSLIAKSKGGGGHKAAAGFECNSLEEIFK